MIANVICPNCGAGKMDVGEVSTMEEAQEKINAARISSCPFGHHISLNPDGIAYEVVSIEEGSAPTDEVWLHEQKQTFDLWTTDELVEAGIKITGFAMGYPIAEVNGKEIHSLNFATSPSGKRYYYAPKGEVDALRGS